MRIGLLDEEGLERADVEVHRHEVGGHGGHSLVLEDVQSLAHRGVDQSPVLAMAKPGR